MGSQLAPNQEYMCLIVFINALMLQKYIFIKCRSNIIVSQSINILVSFA